jgi:hypothetical protein
VVLKESQTCTAEIDRDKVCGQKKYCTKDRMTRAEAYYRTDDLRP